MQITHTNELVDSYEFSKADFTRHGIEDQGAVKFTKENGKTNEVTDEAAAFILENHPEFKATDELTSKEAAAADADLDTANGPVSKTEEGATSAGTVDTDAAGGPPPKAPKAPKSTAGS